MGMAECAAASRWLAPAPSFKRLNIFQPNAQTDNREIDFVFFFFLFWRSGH